MRILVAILGGSFLLSRCDFSVLVSRVLSTMGQMSCLLAFFRYLQSCSTASNIK